MFLVVFFLLLMEVWLDAVIFISKEMSWLCIEMESIGFSTRSGIFIVVLPLVNVIVFEAVLASLFIENPPI